VKNLEPEKPPNHERWIISYADFTTLLLATFVVMYAVSTINSSKFQQMAESFSTAFIGRTTHIQDSGFAAAQKAPFTAMPNPVHLPIITREQEVKNLPPAMRQEPTSGDPNQKSENGKYLASGGEATPPPIQAQLQGHTEESVAAPNDPLRQQVEERVHDLDAAYNQLTTALAQLIGKGEVHVSLQSLGVVVDINEVLLFNSGKADLTPAALPLIDEIARILAGLHYQIQVNGFTDNVRIHTAQFDSNWDLSATRAISVVKRFVAADIDPTRSVCSKVSSSRYSAARARRRSVFARASLSSWVRSATLASSSSECMASCCSASCCLVTSRATALMRPSSRVAWPLHSSQR